MWKTAIGRLRWIGNVEGISYLLLLFIAMPLKYWADFPQAVSVVGALHGLLFTLFLAALLHAAIVKRFSLLLVLGAFISAFIPFGTFILDKKLQAR
ncbi:DUF3817 domain-containing protein [Paenibacillus sp. GD4]|jgi:integral membrane protein|uniref:DUF3817 domain-containing protein n=1 Tax=Paenibacillus sp. GD4 TaxID=3068890 RepID=UPI002796B53C|nr:DUF3817 domain-containing protein [Paenibacillus sp. GD4]MDQ1910235.1 DUF3817 domain-containing protein [Paenibacillus sp. GD4]